MGIDFSHKNCTFKLQINFDRHNARLKFNYCLRFGLPNFSLPSTFNVPVVYMSLIHNGGFWNANTPKRNSLHRKTNIVQNMTKDITFCISAISAIWSLHGIYFTLGEYRFCSHAFEAPPLCSSTVYMARDIMILLRAISITWAIGNGGPWNWDFFGPWNGNERRELPFGLSGM